LHARDVLGLHDLFELVVWVLPDSHSDPPSERFCEDDFASLLMEDRPTSGADGRNWSCAWNLLSFLEFEAIKIGGGKQKI
jgi:hypothetical protein